LQPIPRQFPKSQKNSGGYVINSGISGDRGIKANADAVSSGHHSRISVVTGDKLVVTGDGLPDGSSLGILFAYYEFICLISYSYDTAAIRFCFFYMPTIS
jgi:hypothetical protein